MNYTQDLKEEESIEQGIERLKKTIEIRDNMGGSMYFNIMNDDCCQLASQLVRRGADRKQIHDLIGTQNAY